MAARSFDSLRPTSNAGSPNRCFKYTYALANGVNWWPDEDITDSHVAKASAGDPADLMLTHDSPARTPTRGTGRIAHQRDAPPG